MLAAMSEAFAPSEIDVSTVVLLPGREVTITFPPSNPARPPNG